MIPFKMSTRFITYVPRPTNAIHSSKPLFKSTLKELSTSGNNKLPTRNPFPVKVSAIQKVNGNDGMMVQESLTKICKSSYNGDGDEDDTYFPTVQELIAGRGVSGGHAPEAVDKPALDDPKESISSLNSGNSQGIPVLVEGNKQNDPGSEVDLSDFYPESTRSIAGCSESRQTSLNTTISSSSKPQNSEVDCKVSKAAELSERVRGSLKRKTRSIWGEDLGDLSESQDSSTDSDSDSSNSSDSDDGSKAKSKFDGRPAKKKQKTDNSQHRRKGCFTSGVETTRAVQDELPAADNTESQYTKVCQDPFGGQDPYDGAMKLLGAVCSNELEHNDAMDSRPKEDTNIMSVPQSATAVVICQESIMDMDGQSATLASSPSAIPTLDDPEMPEQAVEVANDKQEWEICDIISKEDVDGVPHYWVQWSATLVPKCEMGKARALIDKFEAGLRAQRKQKDGKGRERLLLLKAGKRFARPRATGKTQQKRGRGRPRKQL